MIQKYGDFMKIKLHIFLLILLFSLLWGYSLNNNNKESSKLITFLVNDFKMGEQKAKIFDNMTLTAQYQAYQICNNFRTATHEIVLDDNEYETIIEVILDGTNYSIKLKKFNNKIVRIEVLKK